MLAILQRNLLKVVLVDPSIGRIAFNLGLTFLILAIMPLFVIRVDSPEFVVDVIAIVILVVFLIVVSWDVRRQVKREYMKEGI